ncbi:nitrate reductase cytochrome c-type subunit [Campylobacter canadensis]|uniref:Periplasmic nitrate reductase, electron transfer subunit n=1 Tax=Campylobacter canadensis TaxID=449520 RepID=A0ABS7WQD6_9BACT|nr:nitrate reductase cytochrome c-type subunit [Campylobacter canadensis]MBZ7986963.1 nitrate reductase cytochrome c-type subunit [Campylobacter canadensis]MBZ7994282.1 nitrate reductase cytochrome c-type subunit [Campylobacter canadensis]MBZ7995726.1 nitrate reductase cytochrome c-type subunit [Campylobacter canadensis]MBZ7997999.1 nitrate reductase cytochrome c-type subunit [Campylobacter canadensis]MBZ7999614.1 nitrate reductase cytochrome c-type subunit [Campylobacter canadensis]
MKKLILSLSACLCLSAASVSDTQIGLRKHSLEDEKSLNINNFSYSDKEPGEAQRFERAYQNAPPQIPHSVEDLLPITQELNMCLSCHDLGKDNERKVLEESEATPIPASHYYDLRNDKSLAEVSPSRYNCVQCHAPQANLDPAVKNTFKPDFKNDLDKHRSNLLDVLNEGL